MRILLRKSGLDLQPLRAIFSLLRFSEKVILISEVIKSVTAIFTHHALSEHLNPLSTNPTKWSNTLKQFVGFFRRIVWVCLTILWDWRLIGKDYAAEDDGDDVYFC